ncbi:hypothetical protein GMDG_03328 [Pseudogymnoascus destructans 20631-21]|uniref:Uncharacterized protein n=1 Tax=Pseudogymnoascus destructans (strain ATCC MYA-4855 / 20631-21) TaxID=658429 RepID=L8G9E6_PSED2|nr:hypothetical protein GMDG_03328 [Pseudogymnoascus destructans 20631-21]
METVTTIWNMKSDPEMAACPLLDPPHRLFRRRQDAFLHTVGQAVGPLRWLAGCTWTLHLLPLSASLTNPQRENEYGPVLRDTLLSFLPTNIRTSSGVGSQGCKLGHSDIATALAAPSTHSAYGNTFRGDGSYSWPPRAMHRSCVCTSRIG